MTEGIGRPAPADKAAVRSLWESCFPEDGPGYVDWYFGQVYHEENTLCLFTGGALASSLHMIPYTLNIRGRHIEANTLSGVSTGPAFRRQGLARGLMAAALDDMASRGVGFTFLYPFDHGFYERLGWATCSVALEYRLPAEELPGAMPEGYTACIEPEPDIATLSAIYERWSAGRNCAAARSEKDWRKRIEENAACDGFTVSAGYRGEPCGYAVCEIEDGEVNAYELAATRSGAVQAILVSLKSKDSLVHWIAPMDDKAYTLPGRWINRVRLQPHVMFRVTDVPLAFRQASPAFEGEFSIEVTGDNMRPENNGIYSIRAESGKIKAEKADVKPQFCCGIGALAGILTGYMDSREAVSAELAEGRPEAISLLEKMYPKQRNFLFELY